MLDRKPRNPSSGITQAVISADQNFILAKNVNNFTDVISPFFKKSNDKYSSLFVLPINQLHRVQTLYETVSSISQYHVIDRNIHFDCISNIPQDTFNNSSGGYIHFCFVTQKKGKDQEEVYLEPRIAFQLVQDPDIKIINYAQKIRFKSDFLKAFPIILKSGFMFLTVNKTLCQLYMSIINPSEKLVGECSKYEIVNVIQYILPLWSIFDINIGKITEIRLREDFIDGLYNETQPILVRASYNLEKPEEVTISKIGDNIDIPEE